MFVNKKAIVIRKRWSEALKAKCTGGDLSDLFNFDGLFIGAHCEKCKSNLAMLRKAHCAVLESLK